MYSVRMYILKILKIMDRIGKQMRFILKMIPAMIVGYALRTKKSYDDIWLIAERPDEARDNGYHLFKFIRENYPTKNVYYVIASSAKDREKLENLGNIITYGSWQHYVYYALCTRSISTHIHGAAPHAKACLVFYRIMPVKKKTVFLSHGVNCNFHKSHMRKTTKIDLYVCSAIAEYRYMLEHYDYSTEQVKCLGLCRFDKLHATTPKNVILIMPTFRSWLQDATRLGKKAEKLFVQSDYYKRYQSLINNVTLQTIADKHTLKLIFFPHYEIQRYLHLFTVTSGSVLIANKSDYDIQQLLIDAKILITDYSSVHFDFAYMNKPVIYYQFDEDDFRQYHYKKGFFDYNIHGFGPVMKSEKGLVRWLQVVCKDDCRMEKQYLDRVSDFFGYNDYSNTQRNYDAIVHL